MEMLKKDKNYSPAKGFSTPPPKWNSNRQTPAMPKSERKWNSPQASDAFHVIHKVPPTDSPYGRAKHVQLVDKDPNRAISMFWAALNSGDRVDSSLKDMATVMKQLNRSDEAIEAIKSFRHLCSLESQDSLDNILIELYKRSGRLEEQTEMLEVKLKHIEERLAFGGRRTRPSRSHGKKIQITIEQEYSRLLGNLAWAYLQQDKYESAEELYRKALSLDQDKNKQCNLAICLMYMDKMMEAKFLLECARASENGLMEETHAKSFGRASQILFELESQSCGETKKPFSSLIKRDTENEDHLADHNYHETEQLYVRKGVSSCSWNDINIFSPNIESSKCASFGEKIGLRSPCKTSFAGKLNKGVSDVENYYEGRTGFGSKWNGKQERVAGGDIGYAGYMKGHVSQSLAGGSPAVLFTQPRRGAPCSSASAATGCNRKLSFADNGEQHIYSGAGEASCDKVYATESGNCKELQGPCKPIQGNRVGHGHFLYDSSNKSWANMVKDEEKLPGNEYFDENTNCNILFGNLIPLNQTESLSQKLDSLDLEDGCYSQPKMPTFL